MGRPKSESPTREAGIPVRLLPIERKFIEAAAAKRLRELREFGITSLPVGAFLRQGGLELAKKVLGQSLEVFSQEESGGGDRKGKRG